MSKPTTVPSPLLSRRRVFAGAGTAGALAAAAVVLPLAQQGGPVAALGPLKPLTPDTDGRYQVTQHVLRYYQTTQV